MNIVLISIGIFLCLCLSNFCSASEMAYSSCNVLRLENARDDGSKKAGLAVRITEHFDDALSAILIGNNLANIGASSLASVLVILITSSEDYAWVSTVVLTFLVIIFGETIPKITAKKNANRIALRHAYPVRFMMIVLKPLIWLVVKLIELITKGLPDQKDESSDEAVEELQSIIETAEDEDVLDEDQSELVQAAIDFSEISALDVMTARVDVCAIDIEDDWDDIMSVIEEATYSRIPVYEGSIDNIIGVLYLNHFLKAMTDNGRADIRKLLMKPCYVYKTMKLPAVLNQLRKAKQHLAIVGALQPVHAGNAVADGQNGADLLCHGLRRPREHRLLQQRDNVALRGGELFERVLELAQASARAPVVDLRAHLEAETAGVVITLLPGKRRALAVLFGEEGQKSLLLLLRRTRGREQYGL